MSDKHVRMTIEFDIDEEALQEHGLTVQDVLKNITFQDDDVVDGFQLSTDIPGLDPTIDIFLHNGQVVSKEIVSSRSVGDHLDKCRAMVREEIELNGVTCHGMDESEIQSVLQDDTLIAGMAEGMNYYLSIGDGNEYTALEIAFRNGFLPMLNTHRLRSLHLHGLPYLDPINETLFIENDCIFLNKDGQLCCQLEYESDIRPLRHRIQDIQEGDAFFFGNSGAIRTASDTAHQNLDERDEPWIVYGDDGESYFEEDIGTELGHKMVDMLKKIYPDREFPPEDIIPWDIQNQTAESDKHNSMAMNAPDRFSIRLHSNEGGITGIWDAALGRFYEEGNQVLRFAEQENAIKYLADIQRTLGIEPTAPTFTTPAGHAYHIGDGISSHETEQIVIKRVDEDDVLCAVPNAPEREPVSIDRTLFEHYLDTGYFSLAQKEQPTKKSMHDGHAGTWHTKDQIEVSGHTFRLMEHDAYGAAACVIVDEHGTTCLTNVLNGFDEHTVDLLRQEVMSVVQMPDESISIDEMKAYGYAWGGMLPMREEAAVKLWNMDLCPVYRLYEDDSEGMIEDVAEFRSHAEWGGIFGVEKVDWNSLQNQPSLHSTKPAFDAVLADAQNRVQPQAQPAKNIEPEK